MFYKTVMKLIPKQSILKATFICKFALYLHSKLNVNPLPPCTHSVCISLTPSPFVHTDLVNDHKPLCRCTLYRKFESNPSSCFGWTLNFMILEAPLIFAHLHLNCISNLSICSIWTMYYVDMDNILCSNCNFQDTNRMKQRKIVKIK